MILWLPVVLYLALLTYAWLFSESAIFLPHPSSYRDSPAILKLTTRSGLSISALYLPNPEARYTLLVSHGNAEDLGDDRYWLEGLRQAGFGVFAFDYEGYGTSQGKPSEQGAYEDEDAAYDYLVGVLGVRPDRLVIFGRSIGSGPAVYLASRKPAAALILQSPFVSAFRVLTHVPLLPFDRFPNYKRIGHVRCPLLVIHGTADSVIPIWHGQKLYDLAREPKNHFWVPGADHNDLDAVAGESYGKALQKFATSLTGNSSRSDR
ncbi:MAG: alpha/beta hydrolase [Acidobacteriia bacterium]|nr:alpha/beta hydrolase [Terriglobia bacterium]